MCEIQYLKNPCVFVFLDFLIWSLVNVTFGYSSCEVSFHDSVGNVKNLTKNVAECHISRPMVVNCPTLLPFKGQQCCFVASLIHQLDHRDPSIYLFILLVAKITRIFESLSFHFLILIHNEI